MESLEPGLFQRGKGGRIGRIALGPADMGVRRMHAPRKEADQRERLGLGDRIVRPQPEAFAQIRQNRGVLGQRLAIVEAQRRHASLRVDFQIGLGALLALGKIDRLRLVGLAALLQNDMRGHRARAGREIERQHAKIPPWFQAASTAVS